MNVVIVYLKTLQSNHSKVKHIQYDQFKIQSYLTSPLFSTKLTAILFNMRSSMTKGFQSNFPSMNNHQSICPFKCASRDEQRHIFACPVLLSKLTTLQEQAAMSVQYDDIFGGVEEQLEVTMVMAGLLEVREEMLEKEVDSLPVGNTVLQCTGPISNCTMLNQCTVRDGNK